MHPPTSPLIPISPNMLHENSNIMGYILGPAQIHTPLHLPNKYNTAPSSNSSIFVPNNVNPDIAKLIRASLSKSSWNKNATAIKCFDAFDNQSPDTHPWPLSEKSVCEFVSWAVNVKKLKAATIKSYLSAIALAHKFRQLDYSNCLGFLPSILLKGAENLEFYRDISKESRKAMSLPILKMLGHQLAKSDWPKDKIRVVWTACVTAFFGSFRLGEILSPSESRFNPAETLLWTDVKIRTDSVLIHIKVPKGKFPQGEFVDLFEFEGHNCCPVKTIDALYSYRKRYSDKNVPVFTFDNGKFLTAKLLTEIVQTLLKPIMGNTVSLLTGHSFRAALPSALSNNPELASDEEIKMWGRWGSPSYKCYTKLVMKKRKMIFVKLTSALTKKNKV